MKKILFSLICIAMFVIAQAQEKAWNANLVNPNQIAKHKAVARQSFPTTVKLNNLSINKKRKRADNKTS